MNRVSRKATTRGEWRIVGHERQRASFRCLLFSIRNPALPAVLLSAVLVSASGCGAAWLNLTASLGGDVAGQRGSVRVLFINNTPHRAVFTFGTYDQTDQDSRPVFGQFGPNDFDVTLDGNDESEILSLYCGRVFGIGSPGLLSFIEDNLGDATVIEEALIDGVAFYSVASEEPDEGDETVMVGSAPAFEALLGIDFPCNSLLIVRLEFDDPATDRFRVDFELIPSESTR